MRFPYTKLSAVILLLGLLGSVACAPKPEQADLHTEMSPAEIQPVPHVILESGHGPGSKCALAIELEREASKAELEFLARVLRASCPSASNRVFITYVLPGMGPSDGAWATTHFQPNLEVRILGMTSEDVEGSLASADSGAALGRWRTQGILAAVITLYRDGGQLKMKRKFKDGSELVQELEDLGKQRYAVKGSRSSDYYLVRPSGELEMGDEEGAISTAAKM